MLKRGLVQVLVVLLRLLRWTWQVQMVDRKLFDDAIEDGASVFAFWHGEQLPLVPIHADSRIAGMASWSKDGSLLAQVIQQLGYSVIRGSSSRGALSGFRQGLTALRSGSSTALALDGPRGPFQQANKGAVSLAAHSGRPIVFAVSHVWPAVRLNSWDRFQIPMPWAQVRIAYGVMPAPINDKASIQAANVAMMERMQALHRELRTSFST